MTEETQRIAIAEVCPFIEWAWDGKRERKIPFWTVGDECKKFDPLNDRNAMWEAAEAAGEATIKAMRFWLFTICGEMKAHHATAAQEAEALLRAKGLWVD